MVSYQLYTDDHPPGMEVTGADPPLTQKKRAHILKCLGMKDNLNLEILSLDADWNGHSKGSIVVYNSETKDAEFTICTL